MVSHTITNKTHVLTIAVKTLTKFRHVNVLTNRESQAIIQWFPIMADVQRVDAIIETETTEQNAVSRGR